MAYFNRNRQSGEHPSKTVVKMVRSGLESGSWPRALLLTGAEDFLVDWSLRYIRQNLISPATEVLDLNRFEGEETTFDDLMAACESYPMMSPRKMVVLADTDVFSASPKQMDADSVKALADYLSKLPETTLLVFTARSVDKRKALYKAAEKNGIVYDFTPLDDNMLSQWMQKQLKEQGASAASRDLIRFAEERGYGTDYNLYNLKNDLLKAALSGGPSISYQDLVEAAGTRSTDDSFALLDAAFAGRKGQALTILSAACSAETPSKVQGVLLGFLGLLCSQLEIMLCAKEREEEGQSFSAIQSALGVKEYRLKKAMESCRGRNSQRLKKDLLDAYNIEKLMKSGKMDPYLALEVFIASL